MESRKAQACVVQPGVEARGRGVNICILCSRERMRAKQGEARRSKAKNIDNKNVFISR